MAAPAPAADVPEHNKQEREDEDAPAAEDEDTGAQVAPIVQLEEVAVTTGEEDEDPLLDLKAKLYRFDKDGSQWKERGTGTVKLLKHKNTGKVRLVFRQARTLKICANHLVIATTKVQEHPGNEKSCIWHATDFADEELKDELFCIRFPSIENCKLFMETVLEVAESQSKEESKDADDTAKLVEKLSVEDEGKKTEEAAKDTSGDAAASGEKKEKAETEKKDEASSSA